MSVRYCELPILLFKHSVALNNYNVVEFIHIKQFSIPTLEKHFDSLSVMESSRY